jgi:hypothetical protein
MTGDARVAMLIAAKVIFRFALIINLTCSLLLSAGYLDVPCRGPANALEMVFGSQKIIR